MSGTGYDGSRGVYVAVCVIPETAADKPGPCIGGVPSQQQEDVAAGTVQWAPSNWTNADCLAHACGIYTRNDHTALNDRVQDVYVPVQFSE